VSQEAGAARGARPRLAATATRIRAAAARQPAVLAATGLAGLAAAGLAAASVFRHDHFGSNAYDLGVYDQTIWGYSRLEVVENTVTQVPNLLGDHFQPILLALAPLFWVWDDVRMLLLAQAVLLAAASLPIFLWAREQLGLAPAFLFQAAYLGFWGMIGGNLYDFHEVAIAAPVISTALYAALTRRNALLWSMAVLAFLTKENLALTMAALGVYVALVQRRWRLGGALVAVAVPWFVLVLKAIIPGISGGRYAHWEYTALGSGPGAAVRHIVTDPVDTVRLFFTPGTKRTALLNIFGAWLFLPLASPLVLVMVPSLAERFLSDRPEFWAQGFHYSLVLAPMLAFAAIDTTARLRRLVPEPRRALLPTALGAAVVLAGAYFTFGRIKPLDELRRYATAAQVADVRSCLETVPDGASVAATSALVPHLSHRRTVYVLDDDPEPRVDYYAVGAATWMFPFTLADVRALVDRRLAEGYGVACAEGLAAVLARGAGGRRLSPELERALSAS
jgi:uncharacterized membrane protein